MPPTDYNAAESMPYPFSMSTARNTLPFTAGRTPLSSTAPAMLGCVLLAGCAAEPMDYVPKYHATLIQQAGGGTGRESFTVKHMLEQVRATGSHLESLRISIRFGTDATELTPIQIAEISKRVTRFQPDREYTALLVSGPGASEEVTSLESASAAMRRLDEVSNYIQSDVSETKRLYNPALSPHVIEVEFRPVIKPGEKPPVYEPEWANADA